MHDPKAPHDPAHDTPDEDALVRLVARRAPTLALDPRTGLTLDGVALAAIAESFGTPSWVYGADTIRARIRRLVDAVAPIGIDAAAIHYAVKANDHLAILDLMGRSGLGADVVSGGEMRRALAAGIPPVRIVFSGVGKTDNELADAVAAGIGQINVESLEELRALAGIAAASGRVQDVAIRVNPDIDAGTHDKISTGRRGDKFGVPPEAALQAFAEAEAMAAIRLRGLAYHIGSQIMSGAPFAAASARIAALARDIASRGHELAAIDCGGGLGIGYDTAPDGDPAALAAALGGAFAGSGLRLSIEPGRWIVGPAGVLLATVVRVKQASPRPFLVIDAAMNDLARPALYGAWHGIVPLAQEAYRAPALAQDVVGPICESSDVLARARALPGLDPGARVAILDTGAYSAVMSSTYNARPFACQVLVDQGRFVDIRARQRVEDLWRGEQVPGAAAEWRLPADPAS